MNTITLDALHAQADKLQAFASQSKRKLSRTTALEQASQLNGHANYQTAVAAIEKHEAFQDHFKKTYKHLVQIGEAGASPNPNGIHEVHQDVSQHHMGSEVLKKVRGIINPWDSDGHSTDGRFEVDFGKNHISVKLYKSEHQDQCLEVVFEMDADQPRAIVYRPEKCDEPIFSVHSGQSSAVLQYMSNDDQMCHLNRAPEYLAEQIKLVAHSTAAWAVPDPE